MPSSTALSVAAGPAAAQPELPDELLEYIFLRLDDAADLARASASCTSFRRVVSGRRFLRRFRSLHRPPVLGFLDCRGDACCGLDFHPAQSPRHSAPAARAVARSGDFTFSFLADDVPKRWRVSDARDGRLLLARTTSRSWFVFDAFAVYDPLHRRHVQIPPVPGVLMASAVPCGSRQHLEAFLAPAGDDEDEAATSLQVICILFSDATVVAFVYSPATGSWRCVTSFNIETFQWMRYPELLRRRYAYSCFFWTDHCENAMLALDTREMKFFVVDLPPESGGRDKTVVEADELRLGLFIVGERALSLYTTAWQDSGVDGWRHERIIPLPNCHWSVSRGAASEGYILLRGIPRDQLSVWTRSQKKPDAQYFTVEVKTLSVEQLCVLKFETTHDYLYANFPPPFSQPTI